jgi:3-isopropylmalate dehydrogenase
MKITVLPGDGVGPEVVREALKVLRTFSDLGGYELKVSEAAVGGVAIRQYGQPLPQETLNQCLASDAVLLGAVGGREFDELPRHQRPEAGLLDLRRALGGFANLRPARSHKALIASSPYREDVVTGVDVLVVRELLGGAYFGEPRGFSQNGERSAFNTFCYSESEVERVARIAFAQARKRRKQVTSVDKANVLETSRLWRDVVTRVGTEFPDVKLDHMYVDTCALYLSTNPRRFDVILTENLFGDILSDQSASFAGSLGMLPSATIGGAVDLYEPVHGSAPDIAGKNWANPMGAILSAGMMLRQTAGLEVEAGYVERAVEETLACGYRTADLQQPGSRVVSTTEMGDLIADIVCDSLQMHHAYHAV